MFIREQRFPILDGAIRDCLETGLASWTDLTVETQLPATHTRRMVTISDDSGPVGGRVQARRYRINVWADAAEPVSAYTSAKNLGLDAMHVLEADLPGDDGVAAVGGFFGPVDVPDEEPFIVDGAELAHFFFSCVVSVKAAAA